MDLALVCGTRQQETQLEEDEAEWVMKMGAAWRIDRVYP